MERHGNVMVNVIHQHCQGNRRILKTQYIVYLYIIFLRQALKNALIIFCTLPPQVKIH